MKWWQWFLVVAGMIVAVNIVIVYLFKFHYTYIIINLYGGIKVLLSKIRKKSLLQLTQHYKYIDATNLTEAQDGLRHWPPPTNDVLPKIIWSYWHTTPLPSSLQQIIDARRRMLPDWDIRCLSPMDLPTYISMAALPATYHKLWHCHQADLVRLLLLEKFGGLWMDISIIINDPRAVHNLYTQCQQQRCALLAFTKFDGADYIENWCLMAPPNSFLIRFWRQEMHKAITVGFLNYDILLMQEGWVAPRRVEVFLTYLTMHRALQAIRRKLGPPLMATLLLLPAEATMFHLHTYCKSRARIERALTDPHEFAMTSAIPYIKLTQAAELKIDLTAYFNFLRQKNGKLN